LRSKERRGERRGEAEEREKQKKGIRTSELEVP
jgi:hypothetical protein